MRSALDVEAYLYGALIADIYDRDQLAVALDERFAELAVITRCPTRGLTDPAARRQYRPVTRPSGINRKP